MSRSIPALVVGVLLLSAMPPVEANAARDIQMFLSCYPELFRELEAYVGAWQGAIESQAQVVKCAASKVVVVGEVRRASDGDGCHADAAFIGAGTADTFYTFQLVPNTLECVNPVSQRVKPLPESYRGPWDPDVGGCIDEGRFCLGAVSSITVGFLGHPAVSFCLQVFFGTNDICLRETADVFRA